MGNTPSSQTDITIDLSEPWAVPARLLEALAAFDQLVAQIEVPVPEATESQSEDLDQTT